VLDDACWSEAPLVSGFVLYNEPTTVEVQTAFRVTYDADRLYFGVQCAEPRADDLGLRKTARDNHDMFGDETVEIFIEPEHDHANYFQLAFSVGGGVWDSRKSATVWNADLEFATQVGAGQWSLEVALPWADVESTPAQGKVVGFNVCRDRHMGPTREWTNWAQMKANFHDPERFAHLVLSPTPEGLADLQDEFRRGDRSGPIRIFSAEGFADTSYREMAKKALTAIDEQIRELQAVGAEEQDQRTREELTTRVDEYRARLAPIRRKIAGDEPLDAGAWTDLDWELNAIALTLGNVIWEARLSALLSRI
jgi:hypothetical protein